MNFDAKRSTAARIFFLVRAALSILHCICPEHRFRMKRGKDLHQIPHGKMVRPTAENRQPAWASHPPCAPSPMPTTKAIRKWTTSTATTSTSQGDDQQGRQPAVVRYLYRMDHLKEETKVTDTVYQPFRPQSQHCDREMGALRPLQVLWTWCGSVCELEFD